MSTHRPHGRAATGEMRGQCFARWAFPSGRGLLVPLRAHHQNGALPEHDLPIFLADILAGTLSR